MIELTHEPLDTGALVDRATSPDIGAVLLFLGVTRQFDGDRYRDRGTSASLYTDGTRRRMTPRLVTPLRNWTMENTGWST